MMFRESRAIFLQIADLIEEEILSGIYQPDERIPSVREYAAKIEVNVNTVMRSYDTLQLNGSIYNKRGIGYFVSPDARAKILRRNKKSFLEEEVPRFFETMKKISISIDEITKLYNAKNP